MEYPNKLNTESKDFHELLKEIEKSFNLRLRSAEIKNIHTFGELCDIVTDKLKFRSQTPSTQEAFLRLKNAISSLLNIDKEEIRMDTQLKTLFPRKERKKLIRELEFELGFSLKVLRPYLVIEAFFFFVLIGSIITLFFNFIYGLEALALLVLLINLAFMTGKEFNCETVGDLAEKITKDKNKTRGKNSHTFSEEETIEELKFIFGEFRPSEEEITRDTKF